MCSPSFESCWTSIEFYGKFCNNSMDALVGETVKCDASRYRNVKWSILNIRENSERVMRCKLVSQFILLRICLGLGPGPSRPLASAAVARSRNISAGFIPLTWASPPTRMPSSDSSSSEEDSMAAMYARFFAAAFRPSAAARTPARAFFLSFSAARLFKSRAARRAGSVSFVLAFVLCHNPFALPIPAPFEGDRKV